MEVGDWKNTVFKAQEGKAFKTEIFQPCIMPLEEWIPDSPDQEMMEGIGRGLRTSHGINWEVAMVALVPALEDLFLAQTPAEVGSEAARSRSAGASTAVLRDMG